MSDERPPRDRDLDEALEESFPASSIDGQVSVLSYNRTPNSLVLLHTEVAPSLRSRHIADRLAKAAIDAAHAEGLTIVPLCPFVKAYLQKHPQPAK